MIDQLLANASPSPSPRKTYGPDAGENIRVGFEPDHAGADARPDEGQSSEHDSEESRQWKEEATSAPFHLTPKYGLPGEEVTNVWDGEPSQPARENP